ncbi:hypothetical protein Tsubulata_012093 [Turnera subulata]|uniref:Uncharacterized protein n=1 Tax=Turnera subulata TaxID=218843 RepID=A0A9Q0F500_9ROSI|nr:hypothetical protein Tsubulata_012093 [Turnera subulata]
MGIEIDTLRSLTAGWSVAAKRCDSCKTAAAAAFCRVDSAFLCLNCDAAIHDNNNSNSNDSDKQYQPMMSSRHARVWMCEVCEQAPAAVTCKADAAALCVTCDADIHSANPLARRHERLPVEPFYDSAESLVKSSSSSSSSPFGFLVANDNLAAAAAAGGYDQNEEPDGGVPWNILSHAATDQNQSQNQHQPVLGSKVVEMEQNLELKPGFQNNHHLFFANADPFLDFEYQNSMEGMFHNEHSHLGGGGGGSDSVVPVQNKQALINHQLLNNNEKCFDIDFSRSKISSFNYPSSQSLSHSVSSSSLEVGVVPDGNSLSDISYPFGRSMNSGTDHVPGTGATASQATQLCGIDREARVLRYREKRKNRKFEKTIRYASRKAYAETRPRIKGRFAKRTETDSDMDRFFDNSPASVAFLSDAQYGVVPSF